MGVLAFGPSSGYEIRKLLSETTAHFWKESYGQIYPSLDRLLGKGMIEVEERKGEGRPSTRYRLSPGGHEALHSWIRDSHNILRPGRNELLLKLFFARREDAPYLIGQVEKYLEDTIRIAGVYRVFADDPDDDGIPYDSRRLIGATVDYGVQAAEMQIGWCKKTIALLRDLSEDNKTSFA